jgi:hypothetical protein
MKKIGLLSLILALTSGCSIFSSKIENRYVVNKDAAHHIGTNGSNEGYIKFKIKNQGDLERVITMNIDSMPYNKEFDLCSNSGVYRDLKSVTLNKNGTKIPDYKAEKVDCKSRLNISLISNGVYSFSYNIKLLNGFMITNSGGFDKYSPKTSRLSRESVVNLPADNLISYIKQTNGVVIESTLIEISI